VERARNQIGPHLATAEIIDQRIPVAVETLARIAVLVEVRAVEARETVGVIWEMRGDPVKDHTDPARWQASIKRAKSAQEPCRAVGAKRPIGW